MPSRSSSAEQSSRASIARGAPPCGAPPAPNGIRETLLKAAAIAAFLAALIGLWLRHVAHLLLAESPAALARWLVLMLGALCVATILPAVLWAMSLAAAWLTSAQGVPLDGSTAVLVTASLTSLSMIGAYVTFWCEQALGPGWFAQLCCGWRPCQGPDDTAPASAMHSHMHGHQRLQEEVSPSPFGGPRQLDFSAAENSRWTKERAREAYLRAEAAAGLHGHSGGAFDV